MQQRQFGSTIGVSVTSSVAGNASIKVRRFRSPHRVTNDSKTPA